MAPVTQIAHSSFNPAPWRWLPVLIAIGVGLNLSSTVTLSVSSLFSPIAALLGARYGPQGLAVVALGGLPSLLLWRYSALFGDTGLDRYLVALVVYKLAASAWPQGFTLRAPTAMRWPSLGSKRGCRWWC
jgi:hypothetical protein